MKNKSIVLNSLLVFLFLGLSACGKFLGLGGSDGNNGPQAGRCVTGQGCVNLAWDASVDGRVNGYKIYWSTQSGAYNNLQSLDVGNKLVATVPNLTPGTYYFVATAYGLNPDSTLIESSYSNEVSSPINFKNMIVWPEFKVVVK